jgi:hypothetical protein
VLCLLGAVGVLATYLRAAANEHAADDGWTMVRGQIRNERVGQFTSITDPNTGLVTPSYQLQPQVEVQYSLDGEDLTTWVDVPTSGPLNSDISYHHNLAQDALIRYRRGDPVACYCDPDDAATLRLALGDGGRRLAIMGYVLAVVASLPGIGLVLASWLLWRAAGGRLRSHASSPA